MRLKRSPHLRFHAHALLTLACCSAGLAAAQSGADSSRPGTEAACRAEVSKFEQAIGYIRRTQGNAAAADLKEKLLPAQLENEILFKAGYCGLARHIREHKLNR